MNLIPIDQKKIDEQILLTTAELLQQEQVIIHPTETVYGIAGRFDSEKAIEKVRQIKGRSTDQPLSIMVASVDQMLELSGQESHWLRKILSHLFPNPLTVLLSRKKKLTTDFWNRFPLIGFRYPDHLWCQALLQKSGSPLITTSANFTGEAPAREVKQIPAALLAGVAVVLDGGETYFHIPSTIIKIDDIKKTVDLIRAGAMPWERIQKLIKNL